MNNQGRYLEIWTVCSKAGLLLFVIWQSYFFQDRKLDWVLLAYLFYICLSCLLLIIRRKAVSQAIAAVTCGYILICGSELNSLFLLLLPASLLDFASSSQRKWLGPVLVIIPFWFVATPLLPIYSLVTVTCLLGSGVIRACEAKLKRLGEAEENMRADLQRLNRALNDNREFAEQLEYAVKLEERNRLSQRIHDEIGHSMAGALIQMEAAKRLLAVNTDKAGELLGNAITISKEGLEQIRLTLKSSKPKPEELGFHRLRLLIDELSAKQDIKATLTHEGELDVITPIQWKVIQDNATEAVTNTIKYAAADTVNIHVQVLNRFVKAVVADNGKGVKKITKGLGILGMEERAAAIGGTIIADGSNGFSVITLLPIAEAAGEFSPLNQ